MMEEFASYMELMVKCIIVYFVIIFALRLMGKREVGELSVFDVVIYLVMSELLAISITDTHSSIFRSLVPIAVLALMQIAISWILLKSKRIRDLFDGKAVILIRDGCIDQQMMRKERYSIDDLMSQLHGKDLSSPDEVAFAILENNGTLSILPKKSCRVRYPHPLISDGGDQYGGASQHRKGSGVADTAAGKTGDDGRSGLFVPLSEGWTVRHPPSAALERP